MAATPPPSVTPVPTPVPVRGDRSTFSARLDAFITWLATGVTQLAVLVANCYANALVAFDSALLAANQVTLAADQVALASDEADRAEQAADIAVGAANYQGEYSALTSYTRGQSTSYLGGVFYAKKTNLGITPVDGADWFEQPAGIIPLSIFSAEAQTKDLLSVHQFASQASFSLGAGISALNIVDNESIFVVTSQGGSNVSTSTNGQTWTLRPVPTASPVSGNRRAGYDGTGFMVLREGSTEVTRSTDGITYTAVTAVTGAVSGIASIAGRTLVLQTSSTTAYLTTDAGVSWTTVTLPVSPNNNGNLPPFYGIGGKFVYYASGTGNVYYSSTGATGSWTAVNLFAATTQATVLQGTDGIYSFSGAGLRFETSDGVAYSSVTTGVETLIESGRFAQSFGYYNGKPWALAAFGATRPSLGGKIGNVVTSPANSVTFTFNLTSPPIGYFTEPA